MKSNANTRQTALWLGQPLDAVLDGIAGLFLDGTDREAEVAVVVAPDRVARVEVVVDAVGVVGVVRIEGRRPVVAVGPDIVGIRVGAVARCRQEDGLVSVTFLLAGHEVTVDSILCGPCPSTIVSVANIRNFWFIAKGRLCRIIHVLSFRLCCDNGILLAFFCKYGRGEISFPGG